MCPEVAENSKLATFEGNPLFEGYVDVQGGTGRWSWGDDVTTRGIFSRDELRHRYSYAVPTDEAIDAIVRHAPIIEVGAGTGYWAAMIAARGAEIVAYDYRPPLNIGKPDATGPVQPANTYTNERQYHDVIVCNPDGRVAWGFPTFSLFLCWPPIGRMAYDCLRHYEGKTVIYAGEWHGATADDNFHDKLSSEFEKIEDVEIPQWFGLHDSLMIWQRKEST